MNHLHRSVIGKSVLCNAENISSLGILKSRFFHHYNGISTFSRYLARSVRHSSSSSSSSRWQSRQGKDRFAREARVQGLKSRAAFKLLELSEKINEKYKIFRKGQTVIDLGYAPGSWSQVAVDRTAPNGRVVGIDIIPAQPPKGVSTIQGNFLSVAVQQEVKNLLRDSHAHALNYASDSALEAPASSLKAREVELRTLDSVEFESRAKFIGDRSIAPAGPLSRDGSGCEDVGRLVDVVLSDMSAPWEQTTGFWKKSLSDPYFRMMNTSGTNFRDHAGSMDLCNAALRFCFDTLHRGGHFVCKFYQGVEDKLLESRLKTLFAKVYREKPESSRAESKEAYFVALRRKTDVGHEEVFRDMR